MTSPPPDAAFNDAKLFEWRKCNRCREEKPLWAYGLMDQDEIPVELGTLSETHEYICRKCKKELTSEPITD